jgi:hypothetical protein
MILHENIVNQTHHPPPVPERLRAIEEYEQQVADASVTIGEIYALWQGTAEILARIDLCALTRKLRPEVLPVVGAVVSCARDIRASVDNGVALRHLLDALRAACCRSRSAVRVGPRDAAEAHVDPHQSLWQQHR